MVGSDQTTMALRLVGDALMKTPAWDQLVKAAVAEVEDRSISQWPRAIRGRLPGSSDADRNGNVQVLLREGWCLSSWDDVTVDGWQHTPLWGMGVGE